MDVVAIGTGQTGATYRVTADYATDPGDLPQTFVIKLPAQDDTVRDRVVIGYRSECAFYSSVADRVQVPTPQCFYCEITEDAMDFALLLADQAPAVQGDQLVGCGEAEARLAVDRAGRPARAQLVRSRLAGFPRHRVRPAGRSRCQRHGRGGEDERRHHAGEAGRSDERRRPRYLQRGNGFGDTVVAAEYDRFALLHGDYRLDNLLFDPDRTRVSVVDWQTLGVGLPARDLAYFTATSLNSQLRAGIEEELVADYHRALTAGGVSDYDRETCWRDYRLGVLQAPLISALGFAFAAATERGDDMVLTMLSRGCQAIRELGTLELIG